MLRIETISQFEDDFRRMVRTGNDPSLFWAAVEILSSEDYLPDEFRDHELTGRWAGVRDIHMRPDWLLLYQIVNNDLLLIRTGTHVDLFLKP